MIHLGDARTPVVNGVTGRMNFAGDRGRIMRFRYDCYAAAAEAMDGISIFLDTDMLVVDRIDPLTLFERNTDAVLCERLFNRDAPVNVNFRNMRMTEFSGLTVAEAWPYLGCFLATRSPLFLRELCATYDTLEDKYKAWYGDQLALKAVAASEKFAIRAVSEGEYACLVDARNPDRKSISKAKILHFKGAAKSLMRPFSERIMRRPPHPRMAPANPDERHCWNRFETLSPANYGVVVRRGNPEANSGARYVALALLVDSAVRLIGRRPSNLFFADVPLSDTDIERINECDALLIVGAGIVEGRLQILPGFDLATLERIKIPVALMGCRHASDASPTAKKLSTEASVLITEFLERFSPISLACDQSKVQVDRALPDCNDRVLMTSLPVAYPVDPVQRNFRPKEVSDRVVVTLDNHTNIRDQLWMLDTALEAFRAKQHVLALQQGDLNEVLRRHAEKKGYRILRSSRYEDFIALFADTDVHFGEGIYMHLKCLSMGVRSFLASFDLRHRSLANNLNFPLVIPGEVTPFKDYDFAAFVEARRRASPDMIRFVERFRAVLG